MEIKQFCRQIGCWGLDWKCPGDPECIIFKKAKEAQQDLIESGEKTETPG